MKTRNALLLVLASYSLLLVPMFVWRFTAIASGEKNSLQWLPVREWGFDSGILSEASCGSGPARITPLYSFWKLGAYEVTRPCPVTQPCQDATGQARDRKIPAPLPPSPQLERLVVDVVQESDSESLRIVASLPDSKAGLAIPYLHQFGIDCAGFTDRGQCGLYVSVKDFFKAGILLQQVKPQLQEGLKSGQSKRVWIWNE